MVGSLGAWLKAVSWLALVCTYGTVPMLLGGGGGGGAGGNL